MKFTLGWLKEHLDTTASLGQIADRLTALGLEVESVSDRAAQFAPFKVAFVEKAEKHPDADRLKVCVVDTGNEKLQVVCGAPNARAGMKGIFAPVGSHIPGTDITLKKGVIRGQESNGMLVSEREMGLSEDHEGIIDVTALDPALGTPFAMLYGLDDPMIEIGLTPNRADCAGVRGIARDLAAAGLGSLKPLNETAIAGGYPSPIGVRLEFDDANRDACPLFIGRLIRGVRNGPSPAWLQNRLKAIGLRPISALVDITNYICHDLARPLHVFDADKLTGGLHVRGARKGEMLAALNDKTYSLEDGMIAICDDAGVVGLGGIIGGSATGCTEETQNVFLEVASFDPALIARTGRALQISSDARYRFERGIDPAFLQAAAEIATRMIIDLCGGEASEVIQAGKASPWQRTITFDPAFTQKLAGISIDPQEQIRILKGLGFAVNDNQVTPPSWRGDIQGRADLVEEIARIAGFDAIAPASLPRLHAVTASAETLSVSRTRKARGALAGRGLNECVTWSFMRCERAGNFGGHDSQAMAQLRVLNPISAELDQMRPCILPNLIEAAGQNHARGFPSSALFEIGPVFATARPDGQSLVAAGIRCAEIGPKHWAGPETARPADIYDVKADALAVLEICGAPAGNAQITRDAPDWYHPGRSGAIRLGPNVLACFGEIHPALLSGMDMRESVCAFEVFIDRIPQPRKKSGNARQLLTLSPFQPVKRDFAFIVDNAVEAETILRAAASADKNLIAQADIFDIYQGKGVEDGKKSIAFSVTIQPQERTLTEADLEAVAAKIVAAVAGKTGGRLRG